MRIPGGEFPLPSIAVTNIEKPSSLDVCPKMVRIMFRPTVARKILTILFVIVVLLFLLIFSVSDKKHGNSESLNIAEVLTQDLGLLRKKPKLILFYTKLWGQTLWPGFETSILFKNRDGVACKEQNCEITYNKQHAQIADVILFHTFSHDMVSLQTLKKLSATRHPNQVWIYFIHECPHNAKPSPKAFNGFFNWTMNYRRDADITVPYNWEWGTWEKLPANAPRIRTRNYAFGKDKLVYAFISHCDLLRQKYIKKLQDYIPVDVYGKCSRKYHSKPKVCTRNSKECTQLKKRYKFFLAFENSFCTDYITEKFYQTILDGDAVPVVMGGADYKSLAIRNSYINALDFATVEGLANHLKFLDRNDQAYNGYQQWREDYQLGKPRSWSCEVCRMANERQLLRKSYPDLGSWYSVENNCGVGVNKLRTIMRNSDIAGPYIDQYYKDF